MKSTLKALALSLIALLALSVLFYGWITPVHDISGCYIAPIKSGNDEICLDAWGRYRQVYIIEGHERPYNSGSYHVTRLEDFVVAELGMYKTISDDGTVGAGFDRVIQPYRNEFGKVLFTDGDVDSTDGRYYVRVEARKMPPLY